MELEQALEIVCNTRIEDYTLKQLLKVANGGSEKWYRLIELLGDEDESFLDSFIEKMYEIRMSGEVGCDF